MNGWIGIDLDGTLAHYDGWKGIEHIGEPVPRMLHLVKKLLADGKEVKIFTARCWYDRAADHATPRDFTEAELTKLKTRRAESFAAMMHIERWCEKNIGRRLPITCEKDPWMIQLYDDRCIQVEPNTGELYTVKPYIEFTPPRPKVQELKQGSLVMFSAFDKTLTGKIEYIRDNNIYVQVGQSIKASFVLQHSAIMYQMLFDENGYPTDQWFSPKQPNVIITGDPITNP